MEIADIVTIETAALMVESCAADDEVHDIIDEESFIILFQLYIMRSDLAERTVTAAEDVIIEPT